MNAATRQQALAAALLQRAPLWQQAEERTQRLARGRTDDAGDALQLADDYRLLAHDVARARTLLPRSRTREYLEHVYAGVHSSSITATGGWGARCEAVCGDIRRRSLARPYILGYRHLRALRAAGYALVHRFTSSSRCSPRDLIASVEGRL